MEGNTERTSREPRTVAGDHRKYTGLRETGCSGWYAAGVRMCEADSAECVLGRSVFDLISDEHRPAFVRFHEHVCNGIPDSMQFEIVGMQGTRRWMEAHAVPMPLGPDGSIVHLAITHDITAARVAEETIAAQHSQLIHVSRLSSMGQMVAVISHEITQPLAAIANYSSACELLAEQPTPDVQKLREYLAAITAQSARAGQILGRVRNFVRRSHDHRIESDIVQLTKNSLNLVKADMRNRQISVETSFPDRTIFVSVDPVQIQQVIVNLISNACDAIESQPTGRRRILISIQHAAKTAWPSKLSTAGQGCRSTRRISFSNRSTHRRPTVWGWA